ncbi:PREDICTED: multidrug resistance-associated protein 4-like [Amphimedon queenslandica]|uniref:ABC transmembrane type-1 domain-containing protein n=1 Tax=Amphimedon queenslandica TaxID=400682 RepID=A0AAN0JU13_AMPQE|nr:PREDICTED: multidrug resistance-associated protein 4-like [Amphimedon queenslandica]|eukprot:XP_019860381.1 PREDICTED: multidrug resistance-associated protein 4-like [Amphimedon queenslandica]
MDDDQTMKGQPLDPRRKAKYNVISRGFFCWIDPLFWLGCRRSLEFSDLYVHPPEADSFYLLNKFNKYWATELQRKKRGMSPRLLVAWFKCFWWRILLHGLFLFGEVSGFVCQSELIGSLAEYLVLDSPSEAETRDAYLYAFGLTLLSFFIVFIHAIAFYYGHILGMHTRIVFSSALYQKILHLSQVTVGQQTLGHIVNLASNDIHKFDLGLLFPHFLWIAPIHVIVVTYLLYLEIQSSAFVATALLFLQVPLQLILAYIFGKLRLKAAKMTDRRVKVMNEVISGIRVIKMYAWEYDIELLPEGDLTLVGERGVTLSGGQKARVNLARAVYRQADVYLLDDPLSAVDAAVSRHLFERCIRGILSDKIVILVTHQVQYLERCDAILGLKEGCVLVYGNARDVLKEDSGIFELLADDTSTSDDGFNIRKQSISTGLEPQTLVTFEQKLSSLNEENDDHEKDNSVEQSQEEIASLKKISSTDTVSLLYYEY